MLDNLHFGVITYKIHDFLGRGPLSGSPGCYQILNLIQQYDLIIQSITMGEIGEKRVNNLIKAVRNGVGIAGAHGGLGDSFRNNPNYQFMIGGQWVSHPGGEVDFKVNFLDDDLTKGLNDFEINSEQWYVHYDPNIEIIASTTFTYDFFSWIDGVIMPVAWKKTFDKGWYNLGLAYKENGDIENAKKGDISFLSNEKYSKYLNTTKASAIIVDKNSMTNVKTIYAIGDVTGKLPLAHVAFDQGILASEHIAGHEVEGITDYVNMPRCTYSSPQIASIGLTEQEAIEKHLEYKVGMFPFSANGKAMAMGYENGFIKTIIHKGTGEFLGVHMVGMGVTELIHNYALAKEAEIIQENIENTIFPHPTLSEAIHESVLKASDKEIHI